MNIDPVGICWLGGVIHYSLQRDISVSNSKTALYVGFRYFHDKGSLLDNCLLLLGFKVKLLLNSVTLCTLTTDVGNEFSITDTLQIMSEKPSIRRNYFVWKNNAMDKPVLVFLSCSFLET